IVHGPSASACVTLGAKPYFSVLGGDIAAGPGFGGNCVSGTADIIGSNSDAAPYNGSGSQLAALALTNIKSFVTGKVQPGNTGTTWVDSIAGGSSPSELALSNDPASVAIGSGYYGGNYGQANWCVPDYYSNVDETAPGVDTTLNGNNTPTAQLSNTNQVYFVNGDLSIMGSNDIPANGQKTIIKVNGDVYIKKSITYASAGTDVTKIPQLQIIASGSIYVDNSVTQLDGFYAAQGSKLNSAGLFVTCSDAAGQILQSSATCGNQLRINGGVATKQLILNRARGDRDGRYSQPEEPAEIITFSPQFWLPNSTESNSVGAWQSVTSLPPIL
ncbi:hypothetical protein H7097_03950, partial [Aeromicrobium sp.]|nr:hypothetical protein [Candidatus Saccharibacteria bacterium]